MTVTLVDIPSDTLLGQLADIEHRLVVIKVRLARYGTPHERSVTPYKRTGTRPARLAPLNSPAINTD